MKPQTDHKPLALAVSTTAIGDTLLGFPALDALAQDYRLHALVHMRTRELLTGRQGIEQIFSYRNSPVMRLWLALRLAPYRYERVVVLHANDNILRLLPFLRYAKAVNSQGWQRGDLRMTALDTSELEHMLDKRLALAAWCGSQAVSHKMQLQLTPAEMQAGADWLADMGLDPARTVAICPGAALLYKRWPVERFAWVARELSDRGWGVIVLGSASEQGLCDAVRSECPQAKPLMGQPLRLAAAVLAQSRLLIGNDTGTMHLALAVDAPVLAIFGPSRPDAYGPRDGRSRALQVERCCKPCITKACQDPYCLNELAAKTVLREAMAILAGAE